MGNEGYLVSVPQQRTMSFTGRAWPVSQTTRRLDRGLNALGFPLGFPAGFNAGDVLTLAASDFLVEFEPKAGGLTRARLFLRALVQSPPPARPGRGYLVRSTAARSLSLPSALGR